MRKCYLIGLLMTCTVASAVPQQTDIAVDTPDFAIKVTLGGSAKRYLLARSETVVIDISFADEIGPTGNYLADIKHEARGETTFMVHDVKFDPKRVKNLRTADYQVLINVFSGRHSINKNVLDCGLIQDVVSKLQHETHTIRCELGTWAPR